MSTTVIYYEHTIDENEKPRAEVCNPKTMSTNIEGFAVPNSLAVVTASAYNAETGFFGQDEGPLADPIQLYVPSIVSGKLSSASFDPCYLILFVSTTNVVVFDDSNVDALVAAAEAGTTATLTVLLPAGVFYLGALRLPPSQESHNQFVQVSWSVTPWAPGADALTSLVVSGYSNFPLTLTWQNDRIHGVAPPLNSSPDTPGLTIPILVTRPSWLVASLPPTCDSTEVELAIGTADRLISCYFMPQMQVNYSQYALAYQFVYSGIATVKMLLPPGTFYISVLAAPSSSANAVQLAYDLSPAVDDHAPLSTMVTAGAVHAWAAAWYD